MLSPVTVVGCLACAKETDIEPVGVNGMRRSWSKVGSGGLLAAGIVAAALAQKTTNLKATVAAVDPGSQYGALAVDRSKGFIYGFSNDQVSRSVAVSRALEECTKRGGNCSTVVEFAGRACAAYRTLSEKDGSAYGWGVNSTREAADSRASQECSDYAGGAKVCSNHVWSCNSGEGKFVQLKLEAVRPVAAKTDCLVQYNLDVYKDKDWASRFFSPVYRLAAKDCPVSGKSMYHSFGHSEHPGQKPETSEFNPERKDALRQKKGLKSAQDFYAWMKARPSPFSGYRIHTYATVYVTDVTPENLKFAVENVAKHDAGDSRGLTAQYCIDYAPPGATPVAILGAEKCRKWYR